VQQWADLRRTKLLVGIGLSAVALYYGALVPKPKLSRHPNAIQERQTHGGHGAYSVAVYSVRESFES
jgi:hypothetical protein